MRQLCAASIFTRDSGQFMDLSVCMFSDMHTVVAAY